MTFVVMTAVLVAPLLSAFALYCMFLALRKAQADLVTSQRHILALSDKPPAQAQAQIEVHASAVKAAPGPQPNRGLRFSGS